MLSIKEANAPVTGNIKHYIESKGLKKKTVATQAGLTQNELTDILGSRRIIKACEIKRIAEAVGEPVEYLFEQTTEQEVRDEYSGIYKICRGTCDRSNSDNHNLRKRF